MLQNRVYITNEKNVMTTQLSSGSITTTCYNRVQRKRIERGTDSQLYVLWSHLLTVLL